MNLADPFPLQRWRIHARVRLTVHWPEYEGSALRGLWGHALRGLACATGQPACDGCALRARCAYPALFEPEPPPASRTYGDLTPPYVIEPAAGSRRLAPGDAYTFGLVLFGHALADPGIVRRAWERSFAGGIGPAGGAMHIERIDVVDAEVPLPPPHTAPARARLELLTPLFVKREGRPVRAAQLTAADFAWAVVRRVAEVSELHLGRSTGLDFAALKAAAQRLRFPQARWQDERYQRWSSRQQRHTPLAGVVGHGVLEGELAPFWPLLHLGQWLHAGGKASFGLGRYRIEPPTTSHERHP